MNNEKKIIIMSCIEGGSIEPLEPPFATGLEFSEGLREATLL